MSIGFDLKETFELGTRITILRSTGNLVGEFADFEVNSQVTKPFIREFFVEAILAYDTALIPGDLIRVTDGRVYICMNKTPEVFEDEVVSYSCVFYKANVAGSLYRPAVGIRSNKYQKTISWGSPIASTCYALITESLYGNSLETDIDLGDIGLSEHELYVPHSFGIQVNDRYLISSDEYYRIESIKRRRFDNVDVATIGMDTRV